MKIIKASEMKNVKTMTIEELKEELKEKKDRKSLFDTASNLNRDEEEFLRQLRSRIYNITMELRKREEKDS